MTRFVIHNHLPVRARDANIPTKADYVEMERKQQQTYNKLIKQGVQPDKAIERIAHEWGESPSNFAWLKTQRDFRGVVDESPEMGKKERAEFMKWKGLVEQKHPGAALKGINYFKGNKIVASWQGSIAESRISPGAERDFRGVVNRDQEERNRQESYDRHGIRRV